MSVYNEEQAKRLCDFLLSATRLECWEYCYIAKKLWLNGRPLPRMEQMDISRHPWQEYTPVQFKKLWDFSQLLSLSLEGVEEELFAFLTRARLQGLPKIVTFSLKLRGPEERILRYDSHWTEASPVYHEQLSSFIKRLSGVMSLDIHDFDFASLIPALEEAGSRVSQLFLHDRQRPCTQGLPNKKALLNVEVAESLRNACPRLKRLCVAMLDSQVWFLFII